MYHNKFGQILIALFFVAFIQIESYTAIKIAATEIPEYKTVNRTLEKHNLDSLNATVFSSVNKIPETPKKPINASKLKIKTVTNEKPAQPKDFNGAQTIPTNSEKRKVVYTDENGNEMTICINCNEKEDKNTKKVHPVSSITFKGFEVEWANDDESEAEALDDYDDSLEDNKDVAEDTDDDSDENIFLSHDTNDSEEDELRNHLNIQ